MNKFIFTLVISVLSACNSNHKSSEDTIQSEITNPEKEYATVIFRDLEGLKPINTGTFPMPTIGLYNGYYLDVNNQLYGEKGVKIIDFKLYEPQSLVNYNHIDGYSYSYYVEPGDTISIKFENNLPFATSTNKKLEDNDLNATARYSLLYLQNTKFRNFTIPISFSLPEEEKFSVQEYLDTVLKGQKLFLDSLRNKGILSAEVFSLRNAENKINEKYSNIYNNNDGYLTNMFDDSLLLFPMYRAFVNVYINKKYGKQAKNEPSKLFEFVLKDDNITPNTKLSFLYSYLKESSTYEIETAVEDKKNVMLDLTENKIVWNEILNASDISKRIDSKDLILYDREMNKIEFDKLMDTYKGKVVYVDLWASWCSPCIASFPKAKILKDEYKDEPIVFLYLAYNDTERPWMEQNKKHKLDENSNSASYLIASPKAEWIKEMQVKTIPRYLLYDKNGKIANANAPSPSDDNIRTSINSLLKVKN